MLFTEEEINKRNLKVFIVEPYRFPKEVLMPLEVDIKNHRVKMRVPVIALPEETEEGNPFNPSDPPEIDGKVEYETKEVFGFIMVMDPEGNTVAESDLDDFTKATRSSTRN